MSADELKELLGMPEYIWVKEDLLPAYHVLSKMGSEKGNGYQFLPTSEENLLLNLKDDKARSDLMSDLIEFEQVFGDWVDREEVEEAEYRVANVYRHNNKNYHSGTDYKIRITVTGSLLNIGKEQLKMKKGEWSIKKIQDLLFFTYLLSNTNVKALGDTGFLSVVTKDEMWDEWVEGYARYKSSTKSLVQSLISCNKAFLSDVVLRTITSKLMREEFFYECMDSIPGRCKAAEHHFNSVSCSLRYRYAVPSEIWSEIRTKIESIDYASVIRPSLSKMEEGYGDILNETKFLEILKNEKVDANNRMKTDDYESFSDAIGRLNMDGVIRIAPTGDIILLVEERTINTRIDSLEKEIAAMISRWLNEVVVSEPPIIPSVPKQKASYLLSNFETKFREFTIGQLKNRYGENWWKQGVKGDIKDKCEKKQNRDINNRNKHVNIHNYMDFMDPYSLVEWKQNKDIFQPYFPKDLDRLRIKLSELYDIRNDIAHSKRKITEKDVHKIEIYVNDINGWIDMPSIKIEEQKPKASSESGTLPSVHPSPHSSTSDPLKIHIGDSTDETPIYSKSDGVGIEVLLGDGVFWEPGSLNNGNFIIIGGAGAGKTETIRCIVSELEKQEYPVLMVDFHGDMACENCNISTYEMREGSEYYFNPLELDPKFEEITPLRANSDFVDAMLINFPNLGIQQRDDLRDIIKKSYEEIGITTKKETWNRELKFKDIENEIKRSEDKTTRTLKAYLADVFDYELFSGYEKLSVGDILEGGVTHLNLKPLPESSRSLFADLFLRKLYYSVQSMGVIPTGDNVPDKEKFRLFVIVDEAKLLVSEKQGTKAVLNKYATELRKYGVGLILASQLIAHFTDEILANIAVKLCMKAESKKQAKENYKYFGVGETEILNLKQGEGVLIRGNYSEGVKIKIKPTWER